MAVTNELGHGVRVSIKQDKESHRVACRWDSEAPLKRKGPRREDAVERRHKDGLGSHRSLPGKRRGWDVVVEGVTIQRCD